MNLSDRVHDLAALSPMKETRHLLNRTPSGNHSQSGQIEEQMAINPRFVEGPAQTEGWL
jgi:hypothetical protein